MSEIPAVQSKQATSIDYTLIVSRLKAEILQGKDIERCREILSQSNVWRKMPAEGLLQWASLCQMAGSIDTALAVYDHLHRQHSGVMEAWQGHIELLGILGKRQELAQVLAAAKESLPETAYRNCAALVQGDDAAPEDPDMDAATAPFASLRQRQTFIERYLSLFSGREDCFARQWVNKEEQKTGYYPVRRPIEPSDVEDHLAGRMTYGIYLMRTDATVKTAVIDIDLVQAYRAAKLPAADVTRIKRERDWLLRRLQELSLDVGMKPIVEFSGSKGFHFWYCFETPVSAIFARGALESIRKAVAPDVRSFALEVFPKQDQLSGKGLGNLVKLPLGVHRSTGKRSLFIACADTSTEAQLRYLMGVSGICSASVALPKEMEQAKAPVLLHPKLEQWSKEYPELYRLEQVCTPIAMLIASCRAKAALSMREEQVLFQTLGFFNRKKTLLHALLADQAEYNPHLVDFKLSRVRGTPLGCKRIHSLLGYTGDFCRFEHVQAEYAHPLLHFPEEDVQPGPKSEQIENAADAIDNLKQAIRIVERFLGLERPP
ncbi:CRISPR-associated primase-polymerase type A1 [Desulfatirhabdium butyrativorans]|uniref:CRISPR-associated primase-polymerase type A1 n=1 Tax=Desulfatirhabdium butyrativorans TaxID=340467 RepID=UPI000411C6E8|nr:CRISPR-associated primase-polymerase type A1 [Desulfatirhabdium butyrativorans]